MKNIIPASDYRRLKLLNLLFFAEAPIIKKEVATIIECSVNTLNADIEVLNSTFPDEMAHIHEMDKKLSLKTASQINFDYLTAYMISTSHLFQLALSVFNGEKTTISEWAENNFVSRSTFYVKLAEVDTFLARSRLVLNNAPLEIQGGEVNIRFFFYHLFSKCHPYTGWLIDDFDFENCIDKFIQKFEQHLNVYFSPSTRVDYATAIAVSLRRIKQGHTVNASDEDEKFWRDIYTYHNAMEIDFSDLEEALGAHLVPVERYMLLMMSFLGSFTYVNQERMKMRLYYNERFQSTRLPLTEDLLTIVDNRIADTLVLKVTILDYLARFLFIEKANLILDVDYFSKKLTPDTEDKEKILTILKKYEGRPGYQYLRSNREVIATYVYTLFSVALLTESYTRSLHIKIISKSGFMWEEYLKTQIRRYYSEEIIIFCDDLKPKEHWAQHDLIISDSPLPNITDVDVLVWHMPPIKRDFAALGEIVDARLDNK
ncbi:helix-turn-helix domain-containing protein [Listeria rocourtiae]|uniref:helix-turn-helix domain-containing protein n=1 Tax=Listeria rocourtiae TaxID=647910 RepID=UPI003D2F87BC